MDAFPKQKWRNAQSQCTRLITQLDLFKSILNSRIEDYAERHSNSADPWISQDHFSDTYRESRKQFNRKNYKYLCVIHRYLENALRRDAYRGQKTLTSEKGCLDNVIEKWSCLEETVERIGFHLPFVGIGGLSNEPWDTFIMNFWPSVWNAIRALEPMEVSGVERKGGLTKRCGSVVTP